MPIVVDPYLISTPPTDNLQAQQVRDYTQRLVAWEKEAGTKTSSFVMSGRVYAVLATEDLLPTPDTLQRLFSQYDIEEFSPRDIAADCNGFIANCVFLEDLLGDVRLYGGVEHVEGSESVIPEEMRRRLHDTVGREFVASMVYTGCALQDEPPEQRNWSIATAPFAGAVFDTDLRLAAKVRRLGNSAGDAIVETRVEHEWPLLLEPDYLYATYAIDGYWDQPELATRIAWCKRKADNPHTAPIAHKTYTFGGRFVNSLRDSRMQRRPQFAKDVAEVFYTIVSVLQGLPFGNDTHHALRLPLWSHSAKVQTRERVVAGGKARDEAVRVEVCGGNTPLRLHYWRCYDGAYEFSNITTDHDDPTIY